MGSASVLGRSVLYVEDNPANIQLMSQMMAMPQDIKLGLDAGFKRYLIKPLVLPEVLRAIEEVVIS